MIGRDIGTEVLPQAAVKLFLTANAETRAGRRQTTHGYAVSSMAKRDATDATRTHSPMKPAGDALVIDTSDLTIEQTVKAAVAAILNAVPVPN
jgi:cytidylate kinase